MIFNPLGGWFRKHSVRIQGMLADMSGVSQIKATNQIEFDQAVCTLVAARVKWLIIVGGDGTLQGVINCLFARLPLEKWPELTIVPAGTTNMIALDLGTRGRAEQVLARIRRHLQRPDELVLVKRPVLRIEQTGMKSVYGMLFGLGLIARGVKFSQSRVKQLGITGNIFTILIVLRSIAGTFLGRPQAEWRPVHIAQTDKTGVVQQNTYIFALVSALERLLLGIRPYWGQQRAPLHVTFVRQDSKGFWREIWSLITGRGHHLKSEDGYISYNTSSLELWLDDDYIVDGEIYHASSQHGPVRISADGPLVFRVL